MKPPLPLLLFLLSNVHTLFLFWGICYKINTNVQTFSFLSPVINMSCPSLSRAQCQESFCRPRKLLTPYMGYRGSRRWKKESADMPSQAPGLISRMTWLQCFACFQFKVGEISLFLAFMSLYSSVNELEDRGRQKTYASYKYCLYPLVCRQQKV